MKKIYNIFGLFFLSCTSLNAQTNSINLVQFSSGYYLPIDIENCGDNRLFIVQQSGQIFICSSSGVKKSTPYLDISNRVDTTGNSQGLLGLVFDPNYLTNGYFYVDYINKKGHTQISRFMVSAGNINKANPSSEKFILQVKQPFRYHNGGCLKFGPDGYLYIGTGDGDDETGDPNNFSQNPLSLLGKMLRIDVHHGDPYSIPKKNPFVNTVGYLPEIWALGLRNPWRWSFDALTHSLIIADVGQANWEEINLQDTSSKGGENYGWRCYEGDSPFNLDSCKPKRKYTFPISEYSHANGDCSITGGYVYRGNNYSDLYGEYFYADYCSGTIRMLDINNPSNEKNAYAGTQRAYVSFGEDKKHELYITNFVDGNIYRITDVSAFKQINATHANSLKVYPNPAKNNFTIEYNAAKDEEFTLHFYNSMGNEVYTAKRNLKSGLNTWNISVPANIKGNCYFTLTTQAGAFISQRILIE
ncbi:MAG TPA: PQQ-dependent sugar dehydrogenase [Parafilimonas sp.]|nr:PQQ-dependent sugar dehydrogenase [Parafilimonas sp.]